MPAKPSHTTQPAHSDSATQGNHSNRDTEWRNARATRSLLQFIHSKMGSTLRGLFEAEDILQDVLFAAHLEGTRPGRIPFQLNSAVGGKIENPPSSRNAYGEARPLEAPSEESHHKPLRNLPAREGISTQESEVDRLGNVPLPWLRKVALHRIWNLSRNMKPRIRPRKETGLPPSMLLATDFASDFIPELSKAVDGPAVLPNEVSHQEERCQAVCGALSSLDNARRVLLVARGLLELPWSTVGFLTDRKREAVRKLHHRTRVEMAQRYSPLVVAPHQEGTA